MIKSKNLELILIKTPNYLQEKSCIGCSYFRQVKGHFGECVGALDKKNNPTNKYYDSTRIGSACSLYRTSIVLPENVQVKTAEEFRDERLKFNEETKAKRKRIRALKQKGNPYYEKHGLNETVTNLRGFKNQKFTDFYRDLPYQLTSDPTIQKKGYFGHQYNYHIINYAISLLKSKTPTKEVRRKISEYYSVIPSEAAIRQWKFRFLKIKPIPYGIDIHNRKFGLFWNVIGYKLNIIAEDKSNEPRPYCPTCKVNTNVKKHGQRYNINSCVQRFFCIKCTINFTTRGKYARGKFNPLIIDRLPILFKQGLSCREISRVLLEEHDVEMSHKTVGDWLRKDNPDIEFNPNASHRPEIRQRISVGVKKFCQTHPQIARGSSKGVPKRRKWMLEMQKKYADNQEVVKALEKEILLCQ